MSTAELKKLFGDSLQVRDDGHTTFSNDGDADKFMKNSKLRDVFTGAMGRSESDWDDGHKSTNDLGAVVRYLSDGGKPSTETKKPEAPIAHSPKVAHAKARIAQYEEDVYSGKYADDLWNNKGQEASDNFLDRYKMKLGKQDDDGNYFEPEV